MVSMRMRARGSRRRISRVTAMPSGPPSFTSMMITSGEVPLTTSSASLRWDASPTTSMSACGFSKTLRQSRKTAWSSTITTLYAMGLLARSLKCSSATRGLQDDLTRIPCASSGGRALRRSASCREGERSLRAGQRGAQCGFRRRRDGRIEADARNHCAQIRSLWAGELEAVQTGACGSIHRRMGRVLAPLDEEGQETSLVVAQRERPPAEHLPGRALARARPHRLEGHVCGGELLDHRVEIVDVRSPADQPWRLDPVELAHVGAAGLRRVGGDDLQVAPLAEGEKRVARTAARMHAAEGRADAGAALDELDALVQVAAAEQHVVERAGHRRRGAKGQRERAGSDQERPPREAMGHLSIIRFARNGATSRYSEAILGSWNRIFPAAGCGGWRPSKTWWSATRSTTAADSAPRASACGWRAWPSCPAASAASGSWRSGTTATARSTWRWCTAT